VLGGDKPAICITEPGAGSAATEMTTTAHRRGDRWILNGTKHWITGGGVSQLHLVFARAFDEQDQELGIAGFIVLRDPDAGTPQGLVIGHREPAMGLRGIPETEVVFDDLEIPAEDVVIPPEGIKRGFAGLMNAYNGQRVGAATVALGIAQGAFDKALDYVQLLEYVQLREQFGRPICEFQGLQWMLGCSPTCRSASRRRVRWCIAPRPAPGWTASPSPRSRPRPKSSPRRPRSRSPTTRCSCTVRPATHALERMARDARMFTIGGGTAQVLRTLVAGRLLERKLPQTRDGYVRNGRG
jgi:alkylation response protein AidB-like acyl-CoA dehydrogenase